MLAGGVDRFYWRGPARGPDEMSSLRTKHRPDEDVVTDGLQEDIPGGKVGREAVFFAWSAFRTAALALVVGVTLVFSAVLGITIYRSYFAIPEEVEVPLIQGKEIREANEILANLGLRLRIEESRHTGKVPERVVITQEPAAGRKVRKDREIMAVVSLGPEEIEVPDLTGKSLREVKVELANAKLAIGKITYSNKSPDKPEEVINQKPKAGEGVKRGTAIDVQVNKGSGVATVAVPNWKGQNVSDMGPKLAKADLELGGIVWTVNETVPRGQIVGQAPPQGSEVTPGSPVEFEVSAGPSGARVFKQRRLEIELPSGSDVHHVKVIVVSEAGQEVAYRGTHMAGDTMELTAAGPPGAEVEIWVNDKLQSRDKL